MKILVLAPEVPFPVRHGGHVRSYGMIRCLSGFASVHVLAIGQPRDLEAPETRDAFRELGVTIEAFPATGPPRPLGLFETRPRALWHYHSPGLADAVRALASREPPDAAHFEEVVMAQYAELLECPAVLDRQKVEWAYHRSLRYFLRARDAVSPRLWWRALNSGLEASRFQRWDQTLSGRFRTLIVLGETDRRLLAPIYNRAEIHVIPNGVSDAIRPAPPRPGPVRFVLLYGSLDYAPNAEAHDDYFRQVWPSLRKQSELTTLVVGHGVPARRLPLEDPRVELRGFVPDVMSVLGGPGVLLVPLRVGGGVRNKILEALAAGMPVVSTAIGAENLGLVDGRHFLRAESPAEMVAAILRLARSPELVASLAREGAQLVDERYRWERIARDLKGVYEGLVKRAGEGSSPELSRSRA